MVENIFLEGRKKFTLADYMNFNPEGRGNLGEELPITVYRLLEYSLREELSERYGREEEIEVFRGAGFRAGVFFAQNILDTSLPFNQFISSVQLRMAEMKIGVLRIEKFDEETGNAVLTVAEDADCSGLPLLGETVCNYDEGFIAGILSAYTGKKYSAVEIDCWATGDRVCRFHAEPRN